MNGNDDKWNKEDGEAKDSTSMKSAIEHDNLISSSTDDNNLDNLDELAKMIQLRMNDTGLTLNRHLYEQRKKEVEELTQRLQNEAAKAMLQLLDMNTSLAVNQARDSSSEQLGSSPCQVSLSVVFQAETAMKQMEEQVKLTSHHIAEHKRDQTYIEDKLNVLEKKIIKGDEEKIKNVENGNSTEDESQQLRNPSATSVHARQTEAGRPSESLDPRFCGVNNVSIASINSVKSGSRNSKKFPDFTHMPLNDRKAFLSKSGLSPLTVDTHSEAESQINGKPYFFLREPTCDENNLKFGMDLTKMESIERERPCSEERVVLMNELKSSGETILNCNDDDDISEVSTENDRIENEED